MKDETQLNPDPHQSAIMIKDKLNEVSPSMCMAKWLWSSIHLTNGLTNSCYLPPVHKASASEVSVNPKALHNTPEKKEQRRMMLEGSRPNGCEYCWRIEDMGADFLSDRYYRSSEPWALSGWDDVINLGKDDDIEPSYLEVNFNHVCNLACSYCSPHLSSKWAEDIAENGPYPTIIPHNSIEYFKDIGHYPIPSREENVYVTAFWKWWPEMYPKLKSFRMTGGEPLLDKNTYAVLDYIIDNPHPDLELAITTNASVPEKLWNKFINKLIYIMDNNLIKRFRLYVSVDSWGHQAEYIRDGLDFDQLWENINDYLHRVPKGLLSFIVTFNILSLPNIEKLLRGFIELQINHNVQSVDYDSNGNETIYGFHRVFIDSPMLVYPEWQSLKLTPPEYWHYAEKCIEFMKNNIDNGRETRWVGFKPHQIDRFNRSIEYMKIGFTNTETKKNAKINFVKFFDEYDKRRGTDFKCTFPEFCDLYDEWKEVI